MMGSWWAEDSAVGVGSRGRRITKFEPVSKFKRSQAQVPETPEMAREVVRA